MAIGVTLEVKGLQELQKKLRAEVVIKPLHAGIKKATLLLQREVAMATVVDTGRLRASITPKLMGSFGQVGTNVQYAPIVEFGVGNLPSRHMEGSAKVLGEGMFSFALKKLAGKMKDILGDVANAIETRWR